MMRHLTRLWLALTLAFILAPRDGWAQYQLLFHEAGPRIHVQAEALLLDRTDHLVNQPLVLTNDTGRTLLDTEELDMGMRAGPRLTLAGTLDHNTVMELSWFGTHHWQDALETASPNNLRLPGDLALRTSDYLDADTMQLYYGSELHNVEVNAAQMLGQWTLLAGVRYVNLDEDFTIHSVDLDSGASDFRVHSWNNLFGAQVGTRIEDSLFFLNWSFTGKVGLFGNAAEAHTLIRDQNNSVVIRDVNGERGSVALVSDLNLSAIYRLGSRWAARAGYNVMWIQGVALAPDQLDFTNTATSSTHVNTHGGLFLQGVNVGLEACW